MEFFKKYWGWILGGGALALVALRSLKESTGTTGQSVSGSSQTVNAAQSAQAAYAGSGTLNLSGLGSLAGGTTTIEETENGVTFSAIGNSSQGGIQAGAQAGAISLNSLARATAIANGDNSYEYTDPTTGVGSIRWVNTASIAFTQGLPNNPPTNSTPWYWGFAADYNLNNDSLAAIPLGNLGWASATVDETGLVSVQGTPPPWTYGGPSSKYGQSAAATKAASAYLPPAFKNAAAPGVGSASVNGFQQVGLLQSPPIYYPTPQASTLQAQGVTGATGAVDI